MTEQAQPAQTLRSTGLAATATALVALVAMSAVASAPAPRAIAVEGRLDTRVVRVVAAVVAAAARGPSGERVTPAGAYFDAPLGLPVAVAARHAPAAPCGGLPAPPLLGEGLLDLPPPAC